MTTKKRQCPVCGKAEMAEHKPFCSKRCADIDLGRWLTESYAVPSDALSEDEDAPDDGN